ncbi:MAG TPA: hypothetical protein VLC53_08195 [Myxococcota bacterium]|nr:hypothetical protein [Myxococcota bacterium]
MSDPQRSGPRPERSASPLGVDVSCEACERTIPDLYYEAGGQVLCTSCKDASLAALEGGSRVGRLLSALALGAVAAAVSAVGWYAITALTGYELGLVAVAVGLLVGAAVRMGSKGRGGWLYQTLAVGLTYAAIASSYVPPAMEALREHAAQMESAEEGAAPAGEELVAAAGEDDPAAFETELDPMALEAAIWTGAIFLAFSWPVFQVTEGGFIGLLIVGFALFEAWKLNKRTTLGLAGPFRVEARPAVPAI